MRHCEEVNATDFDSVNLGSNPSAAIKARTAVLLFLKLNKRLCLVPRGAVV